MAYGDIGSEQDVVTFDVNEGHDASVINLSDGYFAVIYRGQTFHGWLKTFNCDGAGQIALVDSWEISAVSYYTDEEISQAIVHLAGNIYTISHLYIDGSSNQYLICRTLSISNVGIITKSWISYQNILIETAGNPSRYVSDYVRKIGANVYVHVLYGSTGQGYMYTYTMDEDGNNVTSVDNWNFASSVYRPRIRHVSGDYFMLVWDDGANTQIRTLQIDDSGNITKSFDDTTSLAGKRYAFPCLVSGSMFVICTSAGWAHTYTINGAGAITAVDSRQVYSATAAISIKVLNLGFDSSGNYYFLVVSQVGTGDTASNAYTFSVSPVGVVSAIIDSAPYEPNLCYYVYQTPLTRKGYYAFMWNSGGHGGWMDSYDIETPPSTLGAAGARIARRLLRGRI